MRYLKSINERLYFSPSFRDALIHLAEDYQDKVACLFLELRKNDIYDTDEDFNFVELTTQFKMLSFIPYKKRVSDDDEEDNYDVSKSTPIKMGRLAKSIVEKTKNYFTITIAKRRSPDCLRRLPPSFVLCKNPCLQSSKSQVSIWPQLLQKSMEAPQDSAPRVNQDGPQDGPQDAVHPPLPQRCLRAAMHFFYL